MFAVLGVASNRASKAPVCAARALFCHAPALATQLGAVTVIAAVPLWPSLVAVIVAVPPATPVASPLPLTVAAAVLLLAHVTVRPVSVFPAASLVTAASCAVPPTERVADAGLTVTDATGTFVTVTTAVPLIVSLVAVIVAVPAATPVASPLPLTVAAAVLRSEEHTSELQSLAYLVCRLLLEKKKKKKIHTRPS